MRRLTVLSSTVFATKAAITMTSEEGADLILHVGLDTVKLDGKYFNVLVKGW